MNYEKLEQLIEAQTDENEWLDYKQEWHKNKVDLVKDILAFVNTVHHNDCYLIFGVEDKTFKVLGVDEDKNRRNTQQVIDLLTHQNLSGDIPKIKVDAIKYKNRFIDVLTVYNSMNVPLFITRKLDYQGKMLLPGQIITRIGDTTTSYRETANDSTVEKLYRKRMRMDQTIYARYEYLLEQVNDWTYIDSEQKLLYNFDPNFYILIEPIDNDEDERKIHVGDYFGWLVNSSDFPGSWKIGQYNSVLAKYGDHKIFDLSYLLNFDRDRGLIIFPKIGSLANGKPDLSYNYLIEDSLQWKFMSLYIATWDNHMVEEFHDSYYSTQRVLKNIVIYKDNEEKVNIENNYNYHTTVKDLERDFGVAIEPTQIEIDKLKAKNPEYGRSSLLNINIAKAINKRLKNIREVDN